MTNRKKIGPLLVKVSMGLILFGFFMMIQPFIMLGYTYGFAVILGGVILFNIVSHF
jgi:hypothetical protein